MSLANEWADGEDSIASPRSRRRSAERDVDTKDQFHTKSRKKGRRSPYDNADTTNMVAAGYVNNDHDDNQDGPRRGNNYYEGVAEVLAATRGQKRSGANVMTSHQHQRRRCSLEGAQGTPTSTKMECEDLLISTSSAGNSFALVEHIRRECKRSSRWQVQ
jgi:hypothetical protein